MPDTQRVSSPNIAPGTTRSSESLNIDFEPKTVIRKFINSAIYVEKSVMPTFRKRSSIVFSDGESTIRSSVSDKTIRRHSSISRICSCHPDVDTPTLQFSHSEPVSDASTDASSSTDGSQITVKSKKTDNAIDEHLQFSLDLSTSNITGRSGRPEIDPYEKQEIIRLWLQRKDEEKRRREREEIKLRELKERQRQIVIERERENFRRWLAKKKQEEEIAKKEKEKVELDKKKQEEEKENRQRENEERFNQWLQRKKRAELEKKIRAKLALLQVYEERRKRMEENEKAFDEWLKHSKNKPRPIPLNQGLQSLCSSASVTYINPIPWMPNVDLPQKPVSQ